MAFLGNLFLMLLCFVLGGIGSWYFGAKAWDARPWDAESKKGALEASLPKDVSKDFYIKEISVYWIEEIEGAYKVGVLFRIFNKDNTRAHVVSSLGYTGSITINPQAPVVLSPEDFIQGKPFDDYGTVSCQYAIRPGVETVIGFELQKTLHLRMQDKKYPPILGFDVEWNIVLQGEGTLTLLSSQGGGLLRLAKSVITRKEWEVLVNSKE